MSIIGNFNNEIELFKSYPKSSQWRLKDIFSDHWDDFLSYANKNNLNIREVVLREVKRMIECKSLKNGFLVYKCPTCDEEKIAPKTCKSRFCNCCGIKYAKQRSLTIESKLLNCKHRHVVFTIPDSLWSLFLQKRSRLNLMFKAISTTLNSWYKEKYKSLKLTPGYVLTLHTFGRDDKWNVHIHCLLCEYCLTIKGEKKIDYIPFEMLRKRFQTILLNLLEADIGKENFRDLKNKIYSKSSNGFYVYAKKNEFPDSKKAVEYVLRYCGRPCFAQYRIIDIDSDNNIIFWYKRHEDDKIAVERIHIFEFIKRLIRHIPDSQFKTIRYYGFYTSRKNEIYESCKKIIDKVKLSFLKTLNTWRLMSLASFDIDPLKCEKCGTTMVYQYGST